MADKRCSVVVLVSGNGSNLQALINNSHDAEYQLCGVFSNNPDAFGLQRAQQAGIPTFTINHKDFETRASFDNELAKQIDALQPDLIVLAGFMRILSAGFVEHFAHRIVNIHPSLLPKYPGTNTHQRALDAGDKEHGVSIHFVTEDLDGGPVIAHAQIAIEEDDTAATLQQKVHAKEHRIYPQVVSLFASGRLRMHDSKAWLDDNPLPTNGIPLE